MKTISTHIAAALLVSATFVALAPPAAAQEAKSNIQPVAAVLSKEDDQGIRKTVMGFEKAWNTHDMKLLATLFREDAEFVNIVGMHWRGRDAIVAAHTAFHQTMFKNHQMKTDSLEIRLLGSGYAVAVLTATQDSFTTPDGQAMPKAQTRESFVLTKSSDGWKIVHGHNVQINAEAAQNDPVKSRPK